MSAPQPAVAGPTSAGIYDALLASVPGDPAGKDNFASDRAAAAAMTTVTPLVADACRDNRAFLRRAVTWAAREGIAQFLDVGCGFSPLTRTAARAVNADARICYADTNPVVICHADALEPGATAHQADVREADGILGACEADGFDLDQPVCLVLGLLLQYLAAEEAREVAGRYVSRLAAGSAVIVSCGTAEESAAARVLGEYPGDAWWHTRDDMRSFLAGLDIVMPGVIRAPLWRPAGPVSLDSRPAVHVLAGVGVKP